MTRLHLIKVIKCNNNLTKFSKELLNNFLLKSLTYGVRKKVSNTGILSIKDKLYRLNRNLLDPK